MLIEKFRDADDDWRLRFRADDGRVVLTSEAYDSKANADRAATRFHDEFLVRVTTIRG